MKSYLQQEYGFKINKDDLRKIGVIILFVLTIIGTIMWVSDGVTKPLLLGFAAIVGGYMALNIGANDVANNVGPAVGSKAMTLTTAIIIAAICEASGALIAGGQVVDTVRSGIISMESIGNINTFITLMLAALVSGALWLHLATAVGAPVSTTHSIVGGILGAGIAAGGFGVANWSALGKIVVSWVISPISGGIIAAVLLYFIKNAVTYKQDKKAAASRVVPYLIAFMSWAFSLYLISKGLKKIITFEPVFAFSLSVLIAAAVFFAVKPLINQALEKMDNKKEDINKLFTIPLIFAAALLSFAHGANDVANAIGPLAAINDALKEGFELGKKASVPFWIMLIGGIGISIGLALYGPKLIKTVGSEITELDQIRAFCIAMSAALTVLIASELGMPVSSTHIAVGAVFGVGFLREYLKKRYKEMELKILESYKGEDSEIVKEFLNKFRRASMRKKAAILKSIDRKKAKKEAKELKSSNTPLLKKKEQKQLKKVYQEELVKRSAINKIVAAWLITVPVSALFGGACYFVLTAIGL
ncbi:MAG: anion permease [Helicobacter sp.]|nr:inorganic phosphate transporter [Helicobacteraceae bacterium]MDY3112800.1 anion permease [Helicobacter sp.]